MHQPGRHCEAASGGSGGRDKSTPGTLKLPQAACTHAHKELPACQLVSIQAGRTTKMFRLETWELPQDTSFGPLPDPLAKS